MDRKELVFELFPSFSAWCERVVARFGIDVDNLDVEEDFLTDEEEDRLLELIANAIKKGAESVQS